MKTGHFANVCWITVACCKQCCVFVMRNAGGTTELPQQTPQRRDEEKKEARMELLVKRYLNTCAYWTYFSPTVQQRRLHTRLVLGSVQSINPVCSRVWNPLRRGHFRDTTSYKKTQFTARAPPHCKHLGGRYWAAGEGTFVLAVPLSRSVRFHVPFCLIWGITWCPFQWAVPINLSTGVG